MTPSEHTRTNAEIIARFLPVAFAFEQLDEQHVRVHARPTTERADSPSLEKSVGEGTKS
jgi:hypothetical protein